MVDRSEGDSTMLKFKVNERGCTKSVSIFNCWKFIRRIKHDHADAGLSDDDKAQAIFRALKVKESKDNSG